MAWNEARARKRIQDDMKKAPQVEVSRFSDEYLPQYRAKLQLLTESSDKASPPLFDLPKGKAVLVDTVQIYIQITNYDEFRLSEGRETEPSHERALRFLHLYYSACDRVAEFTAAQRVDFHGARMHAVVLDQSGTGVTQETLNKAFDFVQSFRAVAAEANKALANSNFTARFRIGIDAGRCVAINNGTGQEQEPLFLGSAANHAAKLAAGETPGVFVSDNVRAILGDPMRGPLAFNEMVDERRFSLLADQGQSAFRATMPSALSQADIVERWRTDILEERAFNPTTPRFTFHHKTPPLKDIDFSEVSPSKSIRMPLMSAYADLDGYTAYIDSCISKGQVGDAVRALFVVRNEFQKVVENDFGGRKIRFVGDCIHAVLAEGDTTSSNAEQTAKTGAQCAGAIRSSFKLCQEELGCIDALGLAIGLEYGTTPISKIGIRGDRAVRVASSIATTTSEMLQSECGGDQTKFGPRAVAAMSSDIKKLIGHDGVVEDLVYDDVATVSTTGDEAVAAPYYARAHTQSEVPRAHFKTE